MSAIEPKASPLIVEDPALLQQVLLPYKPHCRYLLRAHLEHEGVLPPETRSRAVRAAAVGTFSIPESCYIADTGHFNAVEFNICYNQLAYYLLATCASRQLEPLASWSIEEYRRRQLSDFLIVQFSSSFRRQMKSAHFTGRVEISKVMSRGKSMFLKTYCRFEDGHGGMSEGEPLIAITGESDAPPAASLGA
ncbi:FcoT family thioesterase [Stigmatella erecta]|uniref:(2E)-enoyl-[ACP] glycyltransferase n=1 Tax=Stigmatella erecta TaxID=83460 RepID=A0A1I0HXT4_9BACT|nr:FcoT family thioesterase [Stigmatella erecta]SET88115.1 FcoT-like thioesterase domain-containing protein [Stigmatella erecta]